MSDPEETTLKMVPHDELCDEALEHYLKISNEATHFSSLVPHAIEFYKERWVPRGERKMVIGRVQLAKLLSEGWTFDPWLNPSGRAIILNEKEWYWVLVKGTPEQIAEMDPITVLPELEEEPEPGTEPYGLKTMFIPHNSDDAAPDGYVVMHKDHIFAKGTVYTLPPTV